MVTEAILLGPENSLLPGTIQLRHQIMSNSLLSEHNLSVTFVEDVHNPAQPRNSTTSNTSREFRLWRTGSSSGYSIHVTNGDSGDFSQSVFSSIRINPNGLTPIMRYSQCSGALRSAWKVVWFATRRPGFKSPSVHHLSLTIFSNFII